MFVSIFGLANIQQLVLQKFSQNPPSFNLAQPGTFKWINADKRIKVHNVLIMYCRECPS